MYVCEGGVEPLPSRQETAYGPRVAALGYGSASPRYTAPLAVFTVLRSWRYFELAIHASTSEGWRHSVTGPRGPSSRTMSLGEPHEDDSSRLCRVMPRLLQSRRSTTGHARAIAPRVHRQASPRHSGVAGGKSRQDTFRVGHAAVWPRRKDRGRWFPSPDETGYGEPYWSAQVFRRRLGPRCEDNGLSHPLPRFRRDEPHLCLIFRDRKLPGAHNGRCLCLAASKFPSGDWVWGGAGIVVGWWCRGSGRGEDRERSNDDG